MNRKITKVDIVNVIADKVDVDKKDISRIFDLIFENIKEGLSSDSKIELRGFGTFETKLRKGRDNARNPKSGEIVKTESHFTAVFHPGEELSTNLKKINVPENE